MNKRMCRVLLPLFGSVSLAAGLLAATLASAGPAGAGSFSQSTTLYVSATAPSQPWQQGHGPRGYGQEGRWQQGYGCDNPQYSTISAAVAAAQPGSTIDVCPGTYSEDVVVSEPLTIIGTDAVVNPGSATNSPFATLLGSNAFTVVAQNVTIQGFTVQDASGDGILVAGDQASINHITALDNGGTGVDLNGSSWSTVSNVVAEGNVGGGVYLTNDYGALSPGATASHDTVIDNVLDNNPGGCGVILADHLGTTVPGAQGIFDNTIVGNQVDSNGNDPAGIGSGIILASPVPGGAVYDNTVMNNQVDNNGLAGITLHSHLAGQGDFSGNVLIGNDIGTNNLGGTASEAGGDDGDASTSGIYLGSVDSLSITIWGNVIHDDQDGIFTAGAVTVNGTFFNHYFGVADPFVSTPTYAG
jgi:hypothetical protein